MLFQERYFNFKCLGNFAIHLGIYYYSFIHFLFTSILATLYVIFIGFEKWSNFQNIDYAFFEKKSL